MLPAVVQGSVRRRSSQEERERIGELVRRRSSQGDRLSELLGTPLGDDFMPLVRMADRQRSGVVGCGVGLVLALAATNGLLVG